MRKLSPFLISSTAIAAVQLAGCNHDDTSARGVSTLISPGGAEFTSGQAVETPPEPTVETAIDVEGGPTYGAPAVGTRMQPFASVAAPAGNAGGGPRAAVKPDGVKLAYSHHLSISLPPDFVRRRFIALRDACANDVALHCVLVDATLVSGSGNLTPNAWIHARLPHESAKSFKEKALAPVAGEAPDAARTLQDSTRIDDVSKSVVDVDRRISLLEAYRGRLEQIAARKDSHVDDLIRVANEVSQVQSQIESLASAKVGLKERVDTEAVNVSYQSETPQGGPSSPLRDVWRRGSSIMAASAASALSFVLGALPWAPVAVFAVAFLVGLFALIRRLAKTAKA